MPNYHLVSESVCKGHPDKLADQISDGILDAALQQDKYSRVAVETLLAKDLIVLAGEITTDASIDYKSVAQKIIKQNGYDKPEWGFSDKSKILVNIHKQSPEIAKGVDKKFTKGSLGAGDQGFAYGYACVETKNFMPLPIEMAHKITKNIDDHRESGQISSLRPDGKSQITIEYKNGKPYKLKHVTVAVPHDPTKELSYLRQELKTKIIQPIVNDYGFSLPNDANIIINGTGVWHQPGPASDTGLTGRKIVVDTYGGASKVGGGAFSGKDPSKIDRSAAYLARYLAKNIVANGLAERAEISLAYYIGARQAIFQDINTFGTENYKINTIKNYLKKISNTEVSHIIELFSLDSMPYIETAQNGHFGKSKFPWEKVINL
jgi:S-adenosylmethionine synthetase